MLTLLGKFALRMAVGALVAAVFGLARRVALNKQRCHNAVCPTAASDN